MVYQIAQKAAIVFQTQQRRIGQRSTQAADGVVTVAAMHDDFGHHGVVKRGDDAALHNAIVHADSSVFCVFRLPPQHRTCLRGKAGVGVFHIQARLNGVTGESDVGLLRWQGFA